MTPHRGDPCVLVIFGAAGDMARRLLIPSLYNLACDGLLSPHFAIVGVAQRDLTTAQFREQLSSEARPHTTRKDFDAGIWADLVGRLHFVPGRFEDDTTY